MSCESPKIFNSSTLHSTTIFMSLIRPSYSAILFLQGNKILYSLGNEYFYGVMNKSPALDLFCVKDLSKNITQVWCVSIRIDLSGKSMFTGRRLYIGASTNWSSIAYLLIAFLSTYWISNFLSIMTHLANLLFRVSLLSKYFSGSILATSCVVWVSM